MYGTIAERIERGAALLDEHAPDWPSRVNPARLCIASGCECMVGQVFGNYWDGMGAMGQPGSGSAFGFIAGEGEMDEIEAGWRDLIARRRLAMMPKPEPALAIADDCGYC